MSNRFAYSAVSHFPFFYKILLKILKRTFVVLRMQMQRLLYKKYVQELQISVEKCILQTRRIFWQIISICGVYFHVEISVDILLFPRSFKRRMVQHKVYLLSVCGCTKSKVPPQRNCKCKEVSDASRKVG